MVRALRRKEPLYAVELMTVASKLSGVSVATPEPLVYMACAMEHMPTHATSTARMTACIVPACSSALYRLVQSLRAQLVSVMVACVEEACVYICRKSNTHCVWHVRTHRSFGPNHIS